MKYSPEAPEGKLNSTISKDHKRFPLHSTKQDCFSKAAHIRALDYALVRLFSSVRFEGVERGGYVRRGTDSIRFLAAVSDREWRVASVQDAVDCGPPNL